MLIIHKYFQTDRDQDHSVRLAVGNGLRPDIWAEFQNRFGIGKILEFYGATDGNAVFLNYFNAQGTCGYFSPLMVKV